MKKLLIGTTAVLALTFGVLMNYQPKIDANFDELGIQQELTNHREQLDNHEDRITNTEADVKVIQEKTATPPATERVIIREVVTQPAEKVEPKQEPVLEPEPEPEPIVIVSYTTHTEGDEYNYKVYCDITYSDGSKESRLWKQKHTPTTNGSSVESIGSSCNDSIIGQPKS